MSDPEQKPAVPSSDNGPRSRALRHMNKLLKAGALGGAAFGLAACESCSPMVCDPLPPPMQCQNPTAQDWQQHMSWSAKWVQGDAGSPLASVSVSAYTDQGTLKVGTPQLTGATLVSSKVATQGSPLEFTCAPTAGSTAVVATIPIDCNGAAQSIQLRLDVSGTPLVGGSIPVTLVSPP